MVGGKVVEVITQGDAIWLDVQDTTYPKDFTAVYVASNDESRQIKIGDQVWWQGKELFWTPTDSDRSDVSIPRLSSSGVGVPSSYFEGGWSERWKVNG